MTKTNTVGKAEAVLSVVLLLEIHKPLNYKGQHLPSPPNGKIKQTQHILKTESLHFSYRSAINVSSSWNMCLQCSLSSPVTTQHPCNVLPAPKGIETSWSDTDAFYKRNATFTPRKKCEIRGLLKWLLIQERMIVLKDPAVHLPTELTQSRQQVYLRQLGRFLPPA